MEESKRTRTADRFKVNLCDTGLFIATLDRDAASLILTGEMGMAKGAIYKHNTILFALSSKFYFDTLRII